MSIMKKVCLVYKFIKEKSITWENILNEIKMLLLIIKEIDLQIKLQIKLTVALSILNLLFF